VSNASKFTLEGSIEIKFKQLGELIEFQVNDTGVGVSNEDK